MQRHNYVENPKESTKAFPEYIKSVNSQDTNTQKLIVYVYTHNEYMPKLKTQYHLQSL